MKVFLKYLFLFALFFGCFLAVIFWVWLKNNQLDLLPLPAPNLTNSYSMNDKFDFARGKKADVLAIGSSMTLNNLDSKVVMAELGTGSYLNLSSWGMSMSDIYQCLLAYSDFHLPSTVIISSTIGDFTVTNKDLKEGRIKSFLRSSNYTYPFYFLPNFNLKYYATNYPYSRKVKTDSTSYEFLRYDSYGALLYNPNYLKKSPARWNAAIGQNPEEIQYLYLQKIAEWCQAREIRLLFFQSPVREGMFSDKVNPVSREKIEKHMARVSKIIFEHHQELADAGRQDWNDSLYADNLHFYDFGAERYTQFCFRNLKTK